ncbi:MAG: phosphoribosylanthranilate isomerase [Patescibacteria group bacterium]
MVKVKICGITNTEDALAAISFGADALGFLVGKVHFSTGFFISPEKAAEIIAKLPPFYSSVLVTHLSKPKEVINLAKISNVTTAHLHGSTPEELVEIKTQLPYLKICKVVNVFDEKAIAEAKAFEGFADGITLDSGNRETGQIGGTGKTHDWNISRRIVESVSLPVILAGGLNPDNVIEAIKKVRPYAVDVNFGVSNSDGTKNHEKMKLFIERVKLQ